MAGTTDLIAFFFSATDGIVSGLDPDANQISLVSSAGQVIGGAISLTVDAATSIGLQNLAGVAGISGFVTAVKVSADIQNGSDVSLGDVISLVGNGVMVVAGVAAIGSSAIPMGILMSTLGVVSAAAGLYANQKKWTISDLTNTAYLASRTFVPRRDPLTLDLDGDGLETVGINTAAPILFDHNGDGVKTATGWVKPDDGLLVYDRNGNGSIDSGKELFGDATALYAGGTAADGFAALAQEDSNGDGLVNASDTHWANLSIWRDLNQDGISQAGELSSLASQGIAALKIAKTEHSQTLANGNQIADLGGFIKTDGSGGTLGAVSGMADINLASNPFYSQFTDHVALTTAAQSLADMQGAGMVRDLREAASLDGSFATQIAGLATLSRAQMLSQMDGIVDGWAKTSGMPASIQAAQGKGFILKYLPPGFTAEDFGWLLLNGDNPISSSPDSLPEIRRRAALVDQVIHLKQIIGVLERFNGTTFVTVAEHGVTTGIGLTLVESTSTSSGGVAMAASPYVFVPLNAGSTALLEQSYAQLKKSVYGGVVLQTAMEARYAANDSLWRKVA